MSLVNTHFLMNFWAQRVEQHQDEAAENIEIFYNNKHRQWASFGRLLRGLESFTTDASSRRWKTLLPEYNRILREAERQVSMLAQKMSYRASRASLRESWMAIAQAETGIQQNERVKRLTQLAFIFIPLSFVTSLYGMNVTALGTGSATIWMVVVSAIVTYVVILLSWILLHYHGRTVNWVAARFPAAKLRKAFSRAPARNTQHEP